MIANPFTGQVLNAKPLTQTEILAKKNAAGIKKLKAGRETAIKIQQTSKTPAEGLKQLSGMTETEKIQRKNAEALRKARGL